MAAQHPRVRGTQETRLVRHQLLGELQYQLAHLRAVRPGALHRQERLERLRKEGKHRRLRSRDSRANRPPQRLDHRDGSRLPRGMLHVPRRRRDGAEDLPDGSHDPRDVLLRLRLVVQALRGATQRFAQAEVNLRGKVERLMPGNGAGDGGGVRQRDGLRVHDLLPRGEVDARAAQRAPAGERGE